MRILGIESTCDETACSIVVDGTEILSNVVTSQIDLHNAFGGVVPELACRRHVDVIIPVIEEALAKASLTLSDIDCIAVAYGPGLVGALMIGVTAAKCLAKACNIPFVGVNHVEAHLYAAIMGRDVTFPILGVVLSGGHTALLDMASIGSYTLIGQTVDDAIGEAFDKAAKLMKLPYPGGPEIEKLALKGKKIEQALKGGKVKGRPLDFSFSGLKTAVRNALEKYEHADLAASFQEAAFDDIIQKMKLVADKYTTIAFGGGVTNNKRLRVLCEQAFPKHKLLWPSAGLSLDNAAMIAGLGFHVYKGKGSGDTLDLEAVPTIPF